MEIRFRDSITGRTITGRLCKRLANGNLIVGVMRRSARGRLWVEDKRVVRPEQLVECAA